MPNPGMISLGSFGTLAAIVISIAALFVALLFAPLQTRAAEQSKEKFEETQRFLADNESKLNDLAASFYPRGTFQEVPLRI